MPSDVLALSGSQWVYAGPVRTVADSFGLNGKGCSVARYYHRRSIWGRLLAVFIAIPVIAYLANLTYRWLVPFVPLAAAGVLVIVLCWAGFRRRRY